MAETEAYLRLLEEMEPPGGFDAWLLHDFRIEKPTRCPTSAIGASTTTHWPLAACTVHSKHRAHSRAPSTSLDYSATCHVTRGVLFDRGQITKYSTDMGTVTVHARGMQSQGIDTGSVRGVAVKASRECLLRCDCCLRTWLV